MGYGKAIQIDNRPAGNFNYIQVLHDASLNLVSAGTLRCWIKRILGGNDSYTQSIVTKGSPTLGGTNHQGYGLYIETASGKVYSYYASASGEQHHLIGTVTDANWHCIIGVWNSAQVWGFLDGVKTTPETQTRIPEANSFNLFVGKRGVGETWIAGFNGAIDEMQVHASAKDDADNAGFYNAGVGESGVAEAGLVLGLRFDEASGTACDDYSAEENDGTTQGTVTRVTGIILEAIPYANLTPFGFDYAHPAGTPGLMLYFCVERQEDGLYLDASDGTFKAKSSIGGNNTRMLLPVDVDEAGRYVTAPYSATNWDDGDYKAIIRNNAGDTLLDIKQKYLKDDIEQVGELNEVFV